MALGWIGSTTAFGAVVRKSEYQVQTRNRFGLCAAAYGACCWLRLALSCFKTSDTSVLRNDEATKVAPPNAVSPTASARQITQPMISRLDNPSNLERSQYRMVSRIFILSITGEKGSDIALETVTAGSMNRAIPEGVQGLLSGSLRGIKATKSELPECRYRREAAECERNAEQATMSAD
jgi:hypothetical protein